MKKPITISLITSCLLMSSVNASGIQDWADGVMMTMDSPKSISTRDRTVLYGGGVSIRTPNLTLTPFNVKAPGIKAGCGNIDMVFGSLGFLDADEMVRFAEGILAAAPGVAFDLAMKTLCPSCSETLKALQAMTNQINSMSLDSCQAANAIVGGAFSALSSKQAADEVENSQSNNSFKTERETSMNPAVRAIENVNNFLASLGSGPSDKPKMIQFLVQTNKPSFSEYFLGTKDYINDPIVMTFIRSSIGDIVVETTPGQHGNKSPGRWKYIKPVDGTVENDGDLKNSKNTALLLMERMLGTSENDGSKIYTDTYSISTVSASSFPVGQVAKQMKDQVHAIVTKINSRTALSTDDLNFLGLFKFPVYRIFNTLGSNDYSIEVLNRVEEKLANMLASQIVYELIISINREIQVRIQELDAYPDVMNQSAIINAESIDGKPSLLRQSLSEMAKEARLVAGLSYVIYQKNYEDFSATLSLQTEAIEKARKIRNFSIARSSPEMFEKMMFVNTMSSGMK